MAKVPRTITAAWQQKWTAVRPRWHPKAARGHPGAPKGDPKKTKQTKAHELDESGKGTTHNHRSMAAKVDRGAAKVAPKGHPGTPEAPKGDPKKTKQKKLTN